MKKRPEAVCTTGLIVINAVVFLILSVFGQTEDAYFMLQHGAMYEPLVIERHQYYRIITSVFLHFGIQHLMNNMVMLGALGWNLEREIGKIRFLVIYFVSGIAGNILSMYLNIIHDEQVISAGASGAIFGLMGALVYVVIANRGRLGRLSGRGMMILVFLSLYFGLTSSGVDNWAHIGGLVSGFILALILYRRKRSGEDPVYFQRS
ncbi:MAG TPA: rhomboid family intramembrane serine protease [Candidatus Mediterraneibacter norfolkensis]|nr:rhomboid family intramembrane serine protease [Candidatus Mediterraneibacter norfolkensis]